VHSGVLVGKPEGKIPIGRPRGRIILNGSSGSMMWRHGLD
jgi:hypothetical protein